jgi:hypothetical protein
MKPKPKQPKLTGVTRPQRGWTKRTASAERMKLPGLHWGLGTVIASSHTLEEILEQLRLLWQQHDNIGALRDAFWLCGKMTEPAMPMPAWLVDAIDNEFLNPAWSDRWSRYCRDMIDLRRLDLFQIAHAHGISRHEAGQFVVDVEADAGRSLSVSSVLRLTTDVPKQAAANPGRYYTARSFELPHEKLSDRALNNGQAALASRRPKRLFVTVSREWRKSPT